MTIPGTVRCDRLDYRHCACGWTCPAKTAREARRRWHEHIRYVRASVLNGATA